jgi:hypothetical protein
VRSEMSSPALGLTESPIQKASETISPGVKFNISPQSIADVRYEWSYASTPRIPSLRAQGQH